MLRSRVAFRGYAIQISLELPAVMTGFSCDFTVPVGTSQERTLKQRKTALLLIPASLPFTIQWTLCKPVQMRPEIM